MGEKKKDAPTTVWFSLKKSLHCKSEPSDVHNPKTRKQLSAILTRKTGRSGCSRSIANLKDVIHGSKRHLERPPSCSPRSIGSSEFLNPIAHEVILSNTRCELKITGFGAFNGAGEAGGGGGSTFVGTLRPGTPGPGGHPTMHYFNPSFKNSATPPRKAAASAAEREGLPPLKRSSFEKDGDGVTCHKCGEHFVKWEILESHHLSKHAGNFLLKIECFKFVVAFLNVCFF